MENKLHFLLIFLSINYTFSRDSLRYFIKNKSVANFSIKYLGNDTNWIEYNYHFKTSPNTTNINIRNFNNTLQVGLVLQKDKEFDCRTKTEGNSTEFQGYSLDIINYLNFRNINYTILADSKSPQNQLLNGNIDIVACHPDLDYHSNITKLHPTLVGQHLLVYIPSKLQLRRDIFILSFQGRLWLVFLIILILLAVCLRITTTRYSMIHPNHQAWSWVEITLWAIAAACQQGLSHTPTGFGSCTIFLMGYLMAYLLYTGFAAAITSLLLQHDVAYHLNLNNANMKTFQLICFGKSKNHLANLGRQFKCFSYVDNMERLFNSLTKDNTIGFAPDLLIYQYMSSNIQTNNKFVTIETNLKYMKSFYMLENSVLKKSINFQFAKLQQTGILSNMLKRNLNPVGNDLNTISGYSSAGKEHVGSAIIILCAGVLFAVLFLCAEFVWAVYKKHRTRLSL